MTTTTDYSVKKSITVRAGIAQSTRSDDQLLGSPIEDVSRRCAQLLAEIGRHQGGCLPDHICPTRRGGRAGVRCAGGVAEYRQHVVAIAAERRRDCRLDDRDHALAHLVETQGGFDPSVRQ